MPTKRKWWSENWQSTISMFVMLVFTMGVLYTQLQLKVDRYQVQEIIDRELENQAYPLTNGVRLQSEYKHIEKDLSFLKEELKIIKEKIFTIAKNVELSQKRRTMANKKISVNTPDMAIHPWLEPGIQDKIPIRNLKVYQLQ